MMVEGIPLARLLDVGHLDAIRELLDGEKGYY